MACSICDKAGHDEELHGEEGQEILKLREQNLALKSALKKIQTWPAGANPTWAKNIAKGALKADT